MQVEPQETLVHHTSSTGSMRSSHERATLGLTALKTGVMKPEAVGGPANVTAIWPPSGSTPPLNQQEVQEAATQSMLSKITAEDEIAGPTPAPARRRRRARRRGRSASADSSTATSTSTSTSRGSEAHSSHPRRRGPPSTSRRRSRSPISPRARAERSAGLNAPPPTATPQPVYYDMTARVFEVHFGEVAMTGSATIACSLWRCARILFSSWGWRCASRRCAASELSGH